MDFAVFYRNVNLGRPKSPTRAQLEHAFLTAGVEHAVSFLTNGTVFISVSSERAAKLALAAASKTLNQNCGLVEPGFLRSLPDLNKLVRSAPFIDVDQSQVYSVNVTFLHDRARLPRGVELRTPRKDVEVVRVTPAEALSIVRKIDKTPGNPNALIEKLTGLPATTRTWNTVVRLVKRYG